MAMGTELIAPVGEAGRRRVIERFTWSSVAERTVSLYRRVPGEVEA